MTPISNYAPCHRGERCPLIHGIQEQDSTINMKRLLLTAILSALFYAHSFAQTYGSLNANNNGAANWLNVGTVTLPQGGFDAYIRFIAGSGFNANVDQLGYVELHIKTSNGRDLDANGFGFAATATAFGRSNFITIMRVVPNGAGVSATAYTVFAYCGPYSGNSFYAVETTPGGSWAAGNILASPGSGAYNVPFEFWVNSTAIFNGNVGIGTAAPASKLHVSASASVSVNVETTGAARAQTWYKTPTANFVTGINIDNRFGIVPNTYVSGANGMWMDSLGRVSVGTTDSKGYKFAVNGSIIGTSMNVKLSANWPDYVFKPSYALSPLGELEKYIDAYHHLPEVPSAAEVEKNGLDLGEINKALVKKVEELTLYMIALNKRLEQQQKDIETLKAKK